jgi:hypothetical protein
MQYGAVLHVGAGAHADGVYVAAQYGVHPDRGLLAQNHVADKLGGEVDVATGGNLRPMALVASDHGVSTSWESQDPLSEDPLSSVKEKPPADELEQDNLRPSQRSTSRRASPKQARRERIPILSPQSETDLT